MEGPTFNAHIKCAKYVAARGSLFFQVVTTAKIGKGRQEVQGHR